jgi:hypothetical protein
MSSKLEGLTRRREMLVARAAIQRAELAQAYGELRKPLQIFDLCIGVVQSVARRPPLAVAVAAAFLRSGRLGKLPLKLWIGWQALRPLRFWWSKRGLR